MFDKLESVVNRYEQIGMELTRPDIASNNELFRKLMKEHSDLTPIVEKYREYTSAKEAEKDALEKNLSRLARKPLRRHRWPPEQRARWPAAWKQLR